MKPAVNCFSGAGAAAETETDAAGAAPLSVFLLQLSSETAATMTPRAETKPRREPNSRRVSNVIPMRVSSSWPCFVAISQTSRPHVGLCTEARFLCGDRRALRHAQSPSASVRPNLLLELNAGENRVGFGLCSAIGTVRCVSEPEHHFGAVAVEIVGNLSVDHGHGVTAAAIFDLLAFGLLNANQRLELADQVACEAHVGEVETLAVTHVFVERTFDIEHARVFEVLLEQSISQDHAVVSESGCPGFDRAVAVLLILTAEPDRKDIFAQVGAAAVIAGLRVEQAQREATADQGFLRRVEQIVRANVVLERPAAELAPNSGAIVTAEGPFFRTDDCVGGPKVLRPKLQWIDPGCHEVRTTEVRAIRGHEHATNPDVDGRVRLILSDQIHHAQRAGDRRLGGGTASGNV